ncbi:MAG: NAD(P)H-hydrate dehydratase [Clostridiales bacterium]|jgi:NAD(P)H-hydrate epimerase|nr:NAD(P)H-hydrate dehydratase [Clostridiales bacterium]
MNVAVSRAQMRACEDAYCRAQGLTTDDLTARAAAALAAAVLADTAATDVVAFVCGTGSNGEDGRRAARALANKRKVILCNITPHTAKNAVISALSGATVIVDALFGFGLSKPIGGTFADAVCAVNRAHEGGARVFSVDLPSGIDCDNGLIRGGAVQADVTYCVGAAKRGVYLSDGRDCAGAVCVLELGLGAYIPQDAVAVATEACLILPKRKSHAHKGSYANVKIIGGSGRYVGAPLLALNAAAAALRSGAGLACAAVPASLHAAYAARTLENTLFTLPDADGDFLYDADALDAFLHKADAVAIGMGCGKNGQMHAFLRHLLQLPLLTLIIDADALSYFAAALHGCVRGHNAVILTPHLGEFASLSGMGVAAVEAAPVQCAADYARAHGCIVVLKSNTTVITDGTRTVLAAAAPPALAKGGSGDVLAGVIAGLSGLFPGDPLRAALTAAYAVGEAAARCRSEGMNEHAVAASDVLARLPQVFRGG